jgi:hypothetical protein
MFICSLAMQYGIRMRHIVTCVLAGSKIFFLKNGTVSEKVAEY